MAERSNLSTPILFFLTILLFFPSLGAKDFFTRGEAREAIAAQSMIQTGNWILPTVYNDGVPSKPPFFHWLISAFSLPGGEVTELTARLPSAVASIFFVVFFERFLRRRISPVNSILAAIILFTSVEWFRSSMGCRVDMVFSALLAGGLLAMYGWIERGLQGVPLLAIMLIAGATLTKGPVGIIISVGVLGSYLLLTQRSVTKILRGVLIISVPAIFISALWYMEAFKTGGDKFWAKVYYENVARFTSTMEDSPHKHSVFYLLGTLLLGFLPWTLYAGFGLKKCGQLRERIKSYKLPAAGLNLYAITSAAIITIFFCIPTSKRSTYLLPAYPFYALMIAYFFESFPREKIKALLKVHFFLVTTIFFLIVGFLVAVLLGVPFPRRVAFAAESFRSEGAAWWAFCVAQLFLLGLILLRFGLVLKKSDIIEPIVVWGVGAFCAILFFIDSSILTPPANSLSPKTFTFENREALQKAPVLYSFQDEFYAVSFYARMPILSLDKIPPDDALILLYERNTGALRSNLAEGQALSVVSRSKGGIVKPNEHVVLVRVIRTRKPA